MDGYDPFRFEYQAGAIRYESGAAGDLADELAAQDLERALVVCGQTVGSTPEVIDPVREGLGDRLSGVFDETTPEKLLSTALDGAEAVAEHDADALVALGGGSSLDVAKAISVLAAADRAPDDAAREFESTGTLAVPEDPVPIVAVPTTLAGADLSIGAGLNADPDQGMNADSDEGLVDEPISGGLSSPRLMPAAVVYDPDLVATTPESILAGSAMNGFDKGVETLYAANRTPITDATATRGLGLLTEGLRTMGEDGPTAEALEPVVEGILLVQYGISRAEGTTLSIVHAFGHGLTDAYDVQQGAAHAIVVPHVLRYVFEEVDGRRDLLAEALGVDAVEERKEGEEKTEEALADPTEGVIDAVGSVRDALGLPTRLREVEGADPDDFPAIAETILEDGFVENAPPGLDPTAEEIEAVLEAAY